MYLNFFHAIKLMLETLLAEESFGILGAIAAGETASL
jgi:hypothetical protein